MAPWRWRYVLLGAGLALLSGGVAGHVAQRLFGLTPWLRPRWRKAHSSSSSSSPSTTTNSLFYSSSRATGPRAALRHPCSPASLLSALLELPYALRRMGEFWGALLRSTLLNREAHTPITINRALNTHGESGRAGPGAHRHHHHQQQHWHWHQGAGTADDRGQELQEYLQGRVAHLRTAQLGPQSVSLDRLRDRILSPQYGHSLHHHR